MELVAEVCREAERADPEHVGHWLEHRNDVAALEALISRGYVVDTMEVVGRWRDLPAIYAATVAALQGVEGTLAASAHQSHSYTDGGCLYFTFAAKTEPDDRDRYYREAWDAGTRAVLAAGGALSHHHGVGLNRSRFVAEALGPAFDVLVATKAALDPNGILNPGKLGLPSRFGPPRRTGDEHPRHRRRDERAAGRRRAARRHDRRRAAPRAAARTPRRPAWSSSTRRGWPRSRSRWPGPCWPRAARSTRSASPTSGRPRSCGTARPASRSVRRSAGRTCAPSAPASCSRPTGSAWRPTRRPPRSPTCSTRPTPTAARDLCVGTVDTWLAWHLSEGALHVTDATNAGVTGAAARRRQRLGRPHARRAAHRPRRRCRPSSTRAASSGRPPRSTARRRSPSLVGDQQSSLIGQGGVQRGLAKITFGTGGMLDLHLGEERPRFERAGRPAGASRSSPGDATASPPGASRR